MTPSLASGPGSMTTTAVRPGRHALGESFARALAAKDRDALLAVLHDEVSFRGLTPSQCWSAEDSRTAIDEIVLGAWFEPSDDIEAVEEIDSGQVSDRSRVAYRLRIRSGGELYVCEQQAYYAIDGDRIGWLRVLCSGFRPYPAG